MAVQENTWNVANRMHSNKDSDNPALNHIITGADEIYDDTQNKKQNAINADVARHETEIHGTGGIDSRLTDVEQMEQIVIGGGDAQIATGSDFTNPDATKRAKVPTVGAIVDGLNDGIYDVSKRNPTAGPNSDGKFTLDYILDNADTLIPTGWRHGGMTISFVDSSDNKYVQHRCMAQNFTIDVTQWQGVDDEPTIYSKNLVTSGGVEKALEPITGAPKIDYEWNSNGYYAVNLSSTIGSALPSLTSYSSYRASAKIPCSEGDKFIIHTRSTLACAYFFLDSDSKLLYIPQDQLGTKYKDSNNNTEITAPTGSAFLVVQTDYNEWKSTEFGGDGTTGIYPYRKAVQEIVPQVAQNTSDIQAIQEQIGDSSSGMVKAITDLQTSDSAQNIAIATLEDGIETINGKFPKEYDKTKTYFTVEITAPATQNDFRTLWNNTNIKNETSGTCSVDWGDGTPVVSIVNDDSLKHTYSSAGSYEITIIGITAITTAAGVFREDARLKEARFGNTLINVYEWIINGVACVVYFMGETPVEIQDLKKPNALSDVTKIIVPSDALMKYMNAWYFTAGENHGIITDKIVPDSEVGYIYRDITVSVGTGGFSSINDAIQYLSQRYPVYKDGGVKAVVKILSGTIISKQVYVDGLDLSWITIEYEDYNPSNLSYDSVAEDIADGTIVFDITTGYNAVAVDASGFSNTSHDQRGDFTLFRAENGARLPIIGCVFKLTTPHASTGIAGVVCNRGSEAVIKTLCGFIGFQDGVISNNESSITIREGITMNCSRWGCHARHNGEVSARSVIATGCATDTTKASEYGAAVADRVADMDVREAYLGGNIAIRCNNASTICARAAHVLGGGVENGYLVEATYSGRINASGMTFSNITGNMFRVLNGGWMDAFGVANKTYNVSTLNAIDGYNGIIWG